MKREVEFSTALLRRCEEFRMGRKLKAFFFFFLNPLLLQVDITVELHSCALLWNHVSCKWYVFQDKGWGGNAWICKSIRCVQELWLCYILILQLCVSKCQWSIH